MKFSFLSKYYLYEFRKYISKNFIHLKNIKIVKDPYIIKYKKDNIFMKKLINYISLYQMIKKLLKISCEKIIFFFTFRIELHNSLYLQKYTKSKIYPIIKSAEIIKSSISKLNILIENHFKEEKIPLESIELSYLITNFFTLINAQLSQNTLKYIVPILKFKETQYEKLENEFFHFMMSNPLIINLTKKDTFNISYFTNTLLDNLGYCYEDLKNNDFHEKLFPGGQELIKEHALIMKQFLFFYKNDFSKEKTFLKTKEGFLVSINFTCKLFPSFYDDFFLIIDVMFNDNSLSNSSFHSIKYNNTKINNFNNNDEMITIYSFLLDHHFDFTGLTKNFYLDYDLNQNMFRELKINFCQFFCINENKLIDKINKEKKKLLKKSPFLNQKISLRESNKAYTIFQNIKIENTFKLRNEKFLENYFFPPISIYDKVDKRKLIHKIPEIIGLIDEIGLDYDWYIRLQNFKDKLMINGHLQNMRETSISNITNYNQHISGEYKRSSIFEPNYIESNFQVIPENYFQIAYSIRKLGSISYYIVNLFDKNITNLEDFNRENEDEENNNNIINKS